MCILSIIYSHRYDKFNIEINKIIICNITYNYDFCCDDIATFKSEEYPIYSYKTIFSRYIFIKELGVGAEGRVFEVNDNVDKEIVALKTDCLVQREFKLSCRLKDSKKYTSSIAIPIRWAYIDANLNTDFSKLIRIFYSESVHQQDYNVPISDTNKMSPECAVLTLPLLSDDFGDKIYSKDDALAFSDFV